MRDSLNPFLEILDLDVGLRDAIADAAPPDPGAPSRPWATPACAALAAVSLGREPWAALAAATDLADAVAIAETGSPEGTEWLDHLLAGGDSYLGDVWAVVGLDRARASTHLDWLTHRLTERAALGEAVQRGLPLSHFRPEPDPAPGWREADGPPPLPDPFMPKGWTYGEWYGAPQRHSNGV